VSEQEGQRKRYDHLRPRSKVYRVRHSLRDGVGVGSGFGFRVQGLQVGVPILPTLPTGGRADRHDGDDGAAESECECECECECVCVIASVSVSVSVSVDVGVSRAKTVMMVTMVRPSVSPESAWIMFTCSGEIEGLGCGVSGVGGLTVQTFLKLTSWVSGTN